jgi:hypothetical protein
VYGFYFSAGNSNLTPAYQFLTGAGSKNLEAIAFGTIEPLYLSLKRLFIPKNNSAFVNPN